MIFLDLGDEQKGKKMEEWPRFWKVLMGNGSGKWEIIQLLEIGGIHKSKDSLKDKYGITYKNILSFHNWKREGIIPNRFSAFA